MSVIVSIIKAETRHEKNATKKILDNAAAIKKEARQIADIRAKYRDSQKHKAFTEQMTMAGFGLLAERSQRNNLGAMVWLADEGEAQFDAWCEDENRKNCATLRGIKSASSPKAERKPRQPEGEGDKGEGEKITMKAPRSLADILKNALDQCIAANISPEDFVNYVMDESSRGVYDAAIEKSKNVTPQSAAA